MTFNPKFVNFTHPDAIQSATISLVDAANVVIAGAAVGVPPIVAGAYQVELAVHALTPESNPALAGIPLRAKVTVVVGGFDSAAGYSSEFTFQLVAPTVTLS